jgi:NADH-quinone oxidoreductase subunit M
LAQTIPLFAILFLFFSIANIGLPGTSSFIGEFIILVGVYEVNTFVATFSALGIILGGA